MQTSKFRDLTLMQIDSNRYFTIACDSCGGIGMSELDYIKVDEEIVGYLTAKLCLVETLAFRSKPTVLINTLCVEMDGRGKRIINGIEKAIKEYNEANFYEDDLEINITGSTEENIPTKQTGLGITLMGEIFHPFNRKEVSSGDAVILIGYPKVGQEVVEDLNENKNEIINFHSLKQLTSHKEVSDVLPIGSKGVLFELNQLMETNNKEVKLLDQTSIQLHKSAGPATCALAIIKKESIEELNRLISQPLTLLGEIK
ncbi:hypothetical protein CN692_18595 [Bacillus sp. AFS002410]|uniref:hypothetical protein n=1 Tax=Bacillus sp. AFS002410 TaxID=2033481 RepID=UPI000BEFF4E0|nr:hypothetical protein [Bacillus sp. AFS002410]PEJ56183.1 hypothetical protein CN692_18595 [Bacillus sp. AFS002410]